MATPGPTAEEWTFPARPVAIVRNMGSFDCGVASANRSNVLAQDDNLSGGWCESGRAARLKPHPIKAGVRGGIAKFWCTEDSATSREIPRPAGESAGHRDDAGVQVCLGFPRRPSVYRTTRTSRTLSRARKNLMEAKSRKRVSMWRLLKTRCRRNPSLMAV